MTTKATAIGEFELKVLKRVLQDGQGTAVTNEDMEERWVRFGRSRMTGGDAGKVYKALEKLQAAEYLDYTGEGVYELTEQGEEYLGALGLLD
jgi:hypothetical protein